MRLRNRVSRTIASNYYNDLRQACLAISRNRLIEARTYLVRAHTAAQNRQDQSTLNLLEHAQAIFQELGRLEQQQTQYGEAYLATIKATSEMKANLYLLFEYPHRTFIQLQQFIHLIWLIVWSVIKSAIRISVTAPPSVSAAHAADTIIIESTTQMADQTPSPVVVPPVSTANAGNCAQSASSTHVSLPSADSISKQPRDLRLAICADHPSPAFRLPSDESGSLGFRWQPTLRRELVDGCRQVMTQPG